MQQVEINAEVRDKIGSASSGRLRREGKLPAVLYGHATDGIPLILDGHGMDHLLGAEGFTGLIDLKVSGEAKGLSKKEQLLVLIKDYQADPLTRELLHIDFYKVNLKEEVTIAVPVHIEGSAPGVKAGGILDITRREVEVRCLPDKIPEFITADVSHLEQGDSLHVEDLVLPEGAKIPAEINFTIVSVVAPTKIEEEVPAEEAAEVEGVEGVEAKPGEEKAEEKEEKKEKKEKKEKTDN